MSRRGINAQRRSVGGDTTNQVGDDLQHAQTSSTPPMLQRAVVLDVITDPDLLEEEELDALSEVVSNGELIDVMPSNSVIARITSGGSGEGAQANIILFPFFSSHTMQPVQPGETVYVLFEDYKETGSALGYWFTRIHTARTVEDVNYTHLDRRFDATTNPQNYSTEERDRIASEGKEFTGPGFPNGGGTTETRTLEPDTEADVVEEPYEQIKTQSKAYSESVIEPVPRWRKRPQEHVFQGSNNTLIFLGRDRGGPVVNDDDARKEAGTIGIIAGRGRLTTYNKETQEEVPEGTAPRVIKNTRDELETDKAPYRRGFRRRDNPIEGNPDFINDAAMNFVTMQSEIDRRFGLKLNPTDSLELPDISGNGTFNRSHYVGKADHVRLVARKDEEHGVAGTVLLVREGEPDEDLGYFFIDDKGQIQIEAVKIYLGRATNENEPYIKWTEFDKTVKALQAQIDTMAGNMSLAIGNLGAPIPTLAPTQGQIAANKEAAASAVIASKSMKIFGE